jgi:predicted amidohydrolase
MARPNRPRNSLFVIADKGKLITSYDKRYCSHSDITDWYSAGHHANIFSVDGFRIDCALCIEIQFFEVFRQHEQLDVNCVVFSAFCDDPMFWTQAQGDTGTNNLWGSVIMPAQFGTAVQSGLIGPHGYSLARCEAKMTAQFFKGRAGQKITRFTCRAHKGKALALQSKITRHL